MISAGMLATMIYQLGGGRNGWSVGELIRRVQNMDFFQVRRQRPPRCGRTSSDAPPLYPRPTTHWECPCSHR